MRRVFTLQLYDRPKPRRRIGAITVRINTKPMVEAMQRMSKAFDEGIQAMGHIHRSGQKCPIKGCAWGRSR